jgi:asparagine synthase (glutamine-hydrolysing)
VRWQQNDTLRSRAGNATMCGITGYLQRAPRGDEHSMRVLAEAMAATLIHRGPDAGGTWADPQHGVALGHRRLSIQDLSAAGAQPMASHDGRYVLSYNGEIYNFPALGRELQSLGHSFRGHSDTEVMLAAFLEWGIEAALLRFEGMFAFALWDQRERSLVLARDRAGKKPLYMGWCGATFLFGSELKALRAHPDFNAGIDRDALALFIQYAWVPGPRSIFEGIEKLPAGHWVEIRADGKQEMHCYWSAADTALAGQHEPFGGSQGQAVDALDQLLQDAVANRMVADVGLGSLLSGGYDSTTVTALMQHASDTPVQTFTIGFDEERYDESDHARAIARHLGTDHTELTVSPQDALDIIPTLPVMYDEPFADASQIPTHIVSRLARSQVTVALSGDGGDELFAGYGRYKRPQRDMGRWNFLPRAVRPTLARFLSASAQHGWSLLQPVDGATRTPGWRSFPARLDKNIAALTATNEVSLFAAQRARIADPARYVPGAQITNFELQGLSQAVGLQEPMQGMMLVDFCNYLVDDIRVKVDRASMAVGLEVRAPFLDHRVVSLAWSLPLAMRYGPTGGKLVLRELLQRYVPKELTERPKKGFGVPVADWLRGPLREWAEDLLEPRRLQQQGLFNAAAVSQLWQQHLCQWQDHSDVLWSILMFQAWLHHQYPEGYQRAS